MLLCECDEEESVLMVNPGGYQAWLTTLGGLKDSNRLSWRERNLGREVPMALAGDFFDEAMQSGLRKFDEEEWRAFDVADEKQWEAHIKNGAVQVVPPKEALHVHGYWPR